MKTQMHLARLAVFVMALAFSGCTAVHPPQAGLPSRDSIAPGVTITVQPNQNIYAIAHTYDVPMREIIVLNDLKSPYVLKPGQSLVLPSKSGPEAPPPEPAPRQHVEANILPPPASRVTHEELAPVSLTPPPAATSTSVPLSQPAAPTPLSSQAIVAPVAAAQQPAISDTDRSALTTTAKAAAAKSVASGDAGKSATPPMNMIWPVHGPILSGYGPKADGLNNDGVNIAGPKGAPVVAAAAGTVVYAGNEMKGYGNLILIRHEGGWVTAYAHLARTVVARDSIVAQGDMIGTVGSTGNITSPQLHFEIRHEGKTIDPAGVIKGDE